ncbi:hypothetical protein GOBAR_DD12356 [Gossypium barbadense]|nr:hypothetical protein GOBAR_DD12356 [Gossypium barbadense]
MDKVWIKAQQVNPVQALFHIREKACSWSRSLKEEECGSMQGNEVESGRPIALQESFRYTVYVAWKKGLRGYGVAFLITDDGGKYMAQYCNTVETDDKTMVKLFVVREALRQAAKANIWVGICMEEDKRIESVLQNGKVMRVLWKYHDLVEDINKLRHMAGIIAREDCEQESLLRETKRWAVTSSNIKFYYVFP